MTPGEAKDITVSIRQRLLNKAREENRQFDEFLRYYAIERFLYRLSKSPYVNRFILKGALMFIVWGSSLTRTTSDIDVLGSMENDIERLRLVFAEICNLEVDPDGLVFDGENVSADVITEQADYPGVRVRIKGRLGQAKVSFHVDVGFGDTVIPSPEKVVYPVILGMPAPILSGYSRESAIAEKVEAIVRFGPVNSRMKDFYDIWILSKTAKFKGIVLTEAIKGTFNTRNTRIPDDISELLESIAADTAKQVQWNAFLKRNTIGNAHQEFLMVTRELNDFLAPPCRAISSKEAFIPVWLPAGPWPD